MRGIHIALFLLRCNPHNIQLNILQCTIQWHLEHSLCWATIPLSSFKTFLLPLKNTPNLLGNHCHSSLSSSLICLDRISMDWPILEIHIKEIISYVNLCVWLLLSFSRVFLRFIQVVACMSTSLFYVNNITLRVYIYI